MGKMVDEMDKDDGPAVSSASRGGKIDNKIDRVAWQGPEGVPPITYKHLPPTPSMIADWTNDDINKLRSSYLVSPPAPAQARLHRL
jgi:hypothetical protein